MNDDTLQAMRSMGDMVALLLDGLLELLNSLSRTGHSDAVRSELLVGMAIEVGEICGQLELAQAEAHVAVLTQAAIRRASGRGA